MKASVWLNSSLQNLLTLLGLLSAGHCFAEEAIQTASAPAKVSAFQQIDALLPTPTENRLATGAPGPAYWQQRVSYQIEATLDERRQMLMGKELIRYENNSPHELPYLWLQMEVNQFSPGSDSVLTQTWKNDTEIHVNDLQRLIAASTFDGGMKIQSVKAEDGTPLSHFINKNLMRVDLPRPLAPRSEIKFEVRWEYQINDSKLRPGRTGYEVLDDGQMIFCMAHWYPRLCAYTDYGGWRLKQLIRYGEFTLEFGDFDVKLNVPADHVVSATGVLKNEHETLSAELRDRLKKAETAPEPMFVVTKEGADAKREAAASPDLVTWHFQAENVRDFAFASSRTFIWDAWGCKIGDRTVRTQALYPREGMPLWNQYANHAVAQTLEVYSEVTGIPYPWPHATSVMGVISGGMEYPMINFNGPRPEKDGTYSDDQKRRVIGVIIHETGHNWFPMIVNSDERHWMWLDEGLNTFVQGFAERRWAKKYDRGAQPRNIADYLTGESHQPIMTEADNLLEVGRNAYAKTAAGLTILRETILGRELFDFAFKEYCRRWAYRRSQPADFFRSMEDATGIDLDWFWRGWFYSTGVSDQEITSVSRRLLEWDDPSKAQERHRREEQKKAPNITVIRDEGSPFRVEKHPALADFYDTYDPQAPTPEKEKKFKEMLDRLKPDEREMLKFDTPLYEVRLKNNGTLPMPVILELEFSDGEKEVRRYPAEIWRLNLETLSILLLAPKTVVAVTVDPFNETADPNFSNNRFPRRIDETDLKVTNPEKKIENPLSAAEDLKEKKAKTSESGKDAPESGKADSAPEKSN